MLEQFDHAWLVEIGLRVAKIFVIALVGWWASSYCARKMSKMLLNVYPDQLRANLVSMLVKYGLLGAMLLAICNELGVNISALLAAAGVMGVAIGFAAKTSVANIISGLFLMLERPFDIGDEIDTCSVNGILSEIDLFAIAVRTFDNKVVRIPHEKLLKSVITNLTRLDARRYQVKIKVDYKEDMEKVLAIIRETIAENKYQITAKSPLIRFISITGDYVEVFIGVWAPVEHLGKLKANFVVELKQHFDKHGIKLYQDAARLVTQQ